MSNQIHFGVGNAFAKRTDISNPTPTRFGILQEISVNFEGATKEAYGQNTFPVDVARTTTKVGGSGKMLNIDAVALADLFFGATVTASSGFDIYYDEAHSVPGSSTYTVTVSHVSGGIQDLGVYYSATGVQLRRVAASSEALGLYSVNEGTGVYTFASADASAALLFNYKNASTTYNEMDLSNFLMGSGPVFTFYLTNPYRGKTFNLILNACRITKIDFPFKNIDHTVMDFDFSAFTDSADKLASFATSP